MNVLQFLKNGSGIHIKKENRGKFTDYCGGKVTSECISKGKHSPNPAIRKRATFADNARRWKHEDGGKVKKHQAFVNGVSILDSNPDAYKFVKRKMRKAAEGGNTQTWMQKASNWYNNNSLTINAIGGAVSNIVSSGISNAMGRKALNKQIAANNKKDDVTEAELFNENLLKELEKVKEELINGAIQNSANLGTTINSSPVVNEYLATQRALLKTKAEMDKRRLKTKEKNAELEAEFANKSADSFLSSISSGIGSITDFLSNKNWGATQLSTAPAGTTTTSYASYAPGTTPQPSNFKEALALRNATKA